MERAGAQGQASIVKGCGFEHVDFEAEDAVRHTCAA